MTELTLIRAMPRNAATGVLEPWRLAGGGKALPYYRDGLHYKAGVAQPPRFSASLSFGDQGWSGGCVPSVTAISYQPGNPVLLDTLHALFWGNAAVEVDRVTDDGNVVRRLTGTIADIAEQDGVLSITATDLSKALDQPLATGTFAGTGGIEGESAAEGRVKRRSWGRVFNVEGQLLNTAYSIYEFGDPARPLQGCTALRDKGREGTLLILGWQGSIAETFAALCAAEAPQGGGVFAPSIACAKWWTTPAGPLTADLVGEIGEGYDASVAGISSAVSAALNGPAIHDLAAAVALCPDDAGWHVSDASTTGAAVLDQMLAGAGLFWVLDPVGVIHIREWSWDGDAIPMACRYLGRAAQYAPHKGRKLGYYRNEHQHADGDIAADIPAGDVTYEDGTPVEALKPAEGGATNGAPSGSPVGDEDDAQAVIDGMRTAIATVAQEAIRNGTYRIETDDILFPAPGVTLRQLVDQLGVITNDLVTYVNFLREVSSDGTGKWSLTVENSSGAITGISNMLTPDKRGQLLMAADILKAIDPNGGDPIDILTYGEDNILRMRNVYVEKLMAGAINFEFTGSRQSLGPNFGSQEFPGGLIIKAGKYRGAINDEQLFSVVFPEPFPNYCISFIPVPYLANWSIYRDLWLQCVGEPTRYGATVGTQAATGDDQHLDGFNYIAFGG